MMKKISFEDALILKAARTARFLVRILPLSVSLAVGRWIGRGIYFFSKRRQVAYKNLRAAFSRERSPAQLRAIARRSMENMGMSAIELLKIPDMDLEYVSRHVRIHGTEKFEPYLGEGKGIIFLTAHFGNWELLNAVAGLLKYPMVALARIQKHPRSDQFLNELRTSTGSQVIHKGMPVREILHSLKKGKIVAMLSDQDGGKKGSFVNFFGRLSSTPSGAAVFSLRTGAPIFPVFSFREKTNCHRVEVEGPLLFPDASVPDAEAERFLLQQFADLLEEKIRRAPDQWLWAHRRWKSTPDRSVLILSDGKAGHRHQSEAVLEAFKEERKAKGFPEERVHSKTVEVRFKSVFFKNLFRIFVRILGRRLPASGLFLKMALEEKTRTELAQSYADIVVSCGSALAGINVLVASQNQARSVVIMKPEMPARWFDVILAPRHDKMKQRPNIFETHGALTFVSREKLKSEADKLVSEMHLKPNSRCLGIFIGGDAGRLKYDAALFEAIIQKIQSAGKRNGAALFITSSRRTPAWADRFLKQTFRGDENCPFLLIANEANRNGAVSGMLGLCDVALVSGESMSMISEAAAAGKPVIVFKPFKENKMKSKHKDFLRHMQAEGLVTCVSADEIETSIRRHFEANDEKSEKGLSGNLRILQEAVKVLN